MNERTKRRMLVQELIGTAYCCAAKMFLSIKNVPGAVIERLSPEKRELAKRLTADDFNHRIK